MVFPRRCAQLALAGALAFSALVGFAGGAGAENEGACTGDVVVGVGARLDSRFDDISETSVALPETIQPGRYAVHVVTSDGYAGRSWKTRLNEQVTITFDGGPTVGPTADLPDDADWVRTTHTFETTLEAPASSLHIAHVLSGVEDYNGVRVDCVGLTLLEPPAPPPPVVDDVALVVTPRVACDADVLVIDFESGPPGLTFVLEIDGVPQSITLDDTGFTRTFHDLTGTAIDVRVLVDGVERYRSTVDEPCPPAPDGDDEPGDDDDLPGDDEPGDDDLPGDGDPGDDGLPGDDGEPGDGEPVDDGLPGDGTPPAGDSPSSPPPPPVVEPPARFTPALAVRLDCRTGSIQATLVNDGDAGGQITLAVAPATRVDTVALDAASTTTVTLPLGDRAEGTRAEVVAVTGDGAVLTSEVLVDCLGPAQPTAELEIDCATRTAVLVVGNAGGEPVAITAFAEQVAVLGTATILGGEVVTFSTPITKGPLSVRVVDGAGADVVREVVDHGCEERDVVASLSLLCPAAEVQLVLDNTATEPRTVTVTVGDEVEVVELSAGEQVVLARVFAEPTDLLVESSLGDVLLREDAVEVVCADPDVDPECAPSNADDGWRTPTEPICDGVAVRLVVDCTRAEAVVEIANHTPTPTEIEVIRDQNVVATTVVDAWSVAEVELDSATPGRLLVLRSEDGSALLDTEVSCHDPPDRTAAALGGLLIALMTLVAGVVAVFDPWIRV